MNGWVIAGVVVAMIAIIVAITVPEIREFFGLDGGESKQPPPLKIPPKIEPPKIEYYKVIGNKYVIDSGESVTLRWKTSNAVKVRIAGIGEVELPSGRKSVTPNSPTTTYTLIATNQNDEINTSSITIRVRVKVPDTGGVELGR